MVVVELKSASGGLDWRCTGVGLGNHSLLVGMAGDFVTKS